MLKWIKLLLIAIALVAVPATTTSCKTLIPLIPKIVSVITDAMLVLDTIDAGVQQYFDTHEVSEKVRAKYALARRKCLDALNAAQLSLEGAKDLDQAEYDAAFDKFKAAYLELVDLLQNEGLMSGGALQVGDEAVAVPEPLALKYRVE